MGACCLPCRIGLSSFSFFFFFLLLPHSPFLRFFCLFSESSLSLSLRVYPLFDEDELDDIDIESTCN
jgi:hypothetical protein